MAHREPQNLLAALEALKRGILPAEEDLAGFIEACAPSAPLSPSGQEQPPLRSLSSASCNAEILSGEERSELKSALHAAARELTLREFGSRVYIRGLIEISNRCVKNCLYCGIRAGNAQAQRYRLSPEEIFACCDRGHKLGFRTFVLQGGEDPWFSDERLCAVVRRIKASWPDCAVTLSVGERSAASYAALRKAGADRFLLRHETADPAHYARLHPASQTWQERVRCLRDLKACGFQTGAGFMVGSPWQDSLCLARDLAFLAALRPEMVGIGPFIPHAQTPFARFPAGDVERTLVMISLTRLLLPSAMLPATTALATAAGEGRERGILAGANVVMPNLSPEAARKRYTLYDNKLSEGAECAAHLDALRQRLSRIGYEVVTGRGDHKDFTQQKESAWLA